MAWMRMMGAESVGYHRETVLERGDDHPGAALDYYAERGESPLAWGGAGAARLGLEGHVRPEHYDDMFGPGGAVDPITGDRLAATKRPGMELVVSAHKSVAELGVMGRAEDMHRIMDAERDATMGYLDQVTRERGGRRGVAAVPTATSGLVYAHTRHATSRAGDPCPHDHVLIVNAIEMLDERGGWKAPDTTLWREHLHAATAVGRLASAKVAVDLGYGIVPDHGPSGRLGHWAIAGIPDAAMTLHSKRSEDIAEAVGEVGFESYRARGVAARNTRVMKRHQPVDDLMAKWTAELASIGITVADMAHDVAEQGGRRIAADMTVEDLQAYVAAVLGPTGRLAEQKVFSRRDVIVAVAPDLFGLDPAVLDAVVDRVLADPLAIPLIGVAGAKERAYASACVIATEHAIAAKVADGQAVNTHAVVDPQIVEAAIAAKAKALGFPLTAGQAEAVRGVCGAGLGVDLVLGVAGSGKTTALDAARQAFEAAGYTVIGTATSGQAARTLGRDAGIAEASTIRSLLWRVDHGQVVLDRSTVLFHDEAGMSDDPDMLRLLTAMEAAGGKTVMVGDDRQLGAVGPGGSLGALMDRHQPGVWVLSENVRQNDPSEALALEELRAGDVNLALFWMASRGRIHTATDRPEALGAVVDGWIADVDAGHDTAMYAWRRANVDALNQLGREAWAGKGKLSGPEVEAPGGARYQAGDRIVTLAPGAKGQVVTSERGRVESVSPADGSLQVRMDDGRSQFFDADHTAAGKLAHGYAITVHRSQGATVDTAHRLEDGGGRELAYVAMSRARECSSVYVIADDIEQARDDLARDWSIEHRQRWAIDSGTPSTDPAEVERDTRAPAAMRAVLLEARLIAERSAVRSTIPADVSSELAASRARVAEVSSSLSTLETGGGEWAGTKVGEVARIKAETEQRRRWLERDLRTQKGGDLRATKKTARELDSKIEQVTQRFETLATPHRESLRSSLSSLEATTFDLKNRADRRAEWFAAHPGINDRLHALDRSIAKTHREIGRERNVLDGLAPIVEPQPVPVRAIEPPSRAYDLEPPSRGFHGPGLSL